MLQPGQCSGWLSGGSSCCLSPSLAAVAPSSLPGLLPSSCTQLVLVQRKTNHTLVFSSSFCFLGQIILWLLLLHCLLNNSDISVLLFSITGFAVSIWVLSVNAYLSPLGKIHLFLLLQSEAPVVSDRYTTLAAHTTTRQTTELLLVLVPSQTFLHLQGNHRTSSAVLSFFVGVMDPELGWWILLNQFYSNLY